ncbi:hypothetical protein J4E90_008996 [Alternaria incomplexa]|uniref:uncharacterized protein n=1 Tax=Alternaria incomplexa TaxID=1187928 RepID=UPI00221EC0C9|nr:uncharacterized protein J4E90_008996 [Alternaria incomplexa]KAI4908371.1 hypothetical protein J4E90_008996 [Alternaria incomplexa]
MSKDDRSPEVFAVAAPFFVLTWTTVLLRIYVRAVLMKTWGKDDSYMVAALLTFTMYLPCQIIAAMHGTGRHRWELSDSDAKTALLFWYLCELFYVIANCLLKFAIGYFYLRVAIERWHIWAIRILMLGTVLCGLVYFFLVLLQCIPISDFWNVHPASDRCIHNGPTLGITYALAAINAMADWAFGLLPFFIVWGLEMRTKTKLLVAGILAFAAIGSTGTAIRMAYIHTLVQGPDFLYATTDVALWSTIEPGIGITAGSIATLRPLVRHCLWKMGLADAPREERGRNYYPSEEGGRKRKHRRGYRRSLSPSDLVPTIPGNMTTIQIHGPHDIDLEENLSPPKIVVTDDDVPETPEGQIIHTVTVQQQYEGPARLPEAPPRLQLRDSLRHSFTRGSILSLGKFRVPE